MNIPLEIQPPEALEKSSQGILFVDVREPDEIAQLAYDVPEIVAIPLSQFESRYAEVPRDREIVMVCKGGGRSLKTTRFLRDHGYTQVSNMDGGIIQWVQRGYPVKGAVAAIAPASSGSCCSTQASANDSCCDASRSNGAACC